MKAVQVTAASGHEVLGVSEVYMLSQLPSGLPDLLYQFEC
jgi:hypothetical protein